MGTLSLKRNPVEHRLVLDSFDPWRPFVYYKGLDGSIVAFNVQGWGSAALPKTTDPTLLSICGDMGEPAGITSEPLRLSHEPQVLVAKEWRKREVYKNRNAESGQVLWLPIKPSRIKPDEDVNDYEETDEDDSIGNC